MKHYNWNKEKNKTLKYERDISFENVIIAINENNLLETLKHPNERKYDNQNIFVVKINNYAYLVPFIENNDEIFLKTIIPSRRATKLYIINQQ